MFADTATITRVTHDRVDCWAPDAFIEPRAALLSDGRLTEFQEWETDAQTVVLDNIASRWSPYRKAGLLDGREYSGRGNKFIQFSKHGNDWLITSILWEDVEPC